jgi:hypothetical protein
MVPHKTNDLLEIRTDIASDQFFGHHLSERSCLRVEIPAENRKGKVAIGDDSR